MDSSPAINRTLRILQHAKTHGYAVGAFCCYNDDGVIAAIRAAEQCRSPAIIQLFPWTMRFQGPSFVRYVVEAAHAATVPIAVQLDHCIEKEDVTAALDLPFDSIMVDASVKDLDENIGQCRETVEVASSRGIAIEAEMGRIEGGEDGLPTVDLDTVMTNPEEATAFVEKTGVKILAPSFGNVHGKYGPGGPDAIWRLDIVTRLHKNLQGTFLALHGTHGLSDAQFRRAKESGFTKINLNTTVRDDYTRFVTDNFGEMSLTALKTKAVQVYADSIAATMRGFLDSAGRAE